MIIINDDEQKVMRYERVIDQLQKMIDQTKRQNKTTRTQFEKEIESKTELEHYLKKAVKKVLAEKKKSGDGRARGNSAKYFITALD